MKHVYRSRVSDDNILQIGNLVRKSTPKIRPGMHIKFSKLNSRPYKVINRYENRNFQIKSLHDSTKVEWIHCELISKTPDKSNTK